MRRRHPSGIRIKKHGPWWFCYANEKRENGFFLEGWKGTRRQVYLLGKNRLNKIKRMKKTWAAQRAGLAHVKIHIQ